MGALHADSRGRNPAPPDAAVRLPDKSDSNLTLQVTADPWVGFLTLHRKSVGNKFQFYLRLYP